jgi:hypothetical protein
MTPNQRVVGRKTARESLDLYEAGDNLAPNHLSSERIGQTVTHSDRTLPVVLSKVIASGWTKPSIQIGALLYLRGRGELNLHGLRRLHKLLKNVSSLEVTAASRHEERISKSPESFGILFFWVTRPSHLRSYHRRQKRRIGVGYRDKGSLTPFHSRKRIFGEQNLFYLGEAMEFSSEIPQYLAHLVGVNGILLFRHVSDGWWRILTPFERHESAKRMLEMTLAKY